MAVFKCKMCGGDLEIVNGESVCECEYCGTKQTIPTTDSEKLTNLYNRANRLRFNNEFDKAAGIFENITAEYPEEAEAYWGLCLCKYGIEYVDDPTTAKKIPTCHRTSLESIFDDSNFELAQEYADSVAQRLYREEAKEIDRLQKAILDIAKNEKPYDIFICYKETAPDGQRTKDSVMAQDIYDALIAKGYKVFFARITLEDKLGQEYEPYIFAALSSAKIMLSVGTSYENFNAVWVKNEWSRYLSLMKTDKSKVLIPCYCDIDAYDMPQEFKNLQGQDMGKVGFIQDLVRGVGKIVPAPNDVAAQNVAPVQQAVVQQVVSSNAENLLKRGMLALEEGQWDEADEFFEQVLNENVEEPRAYLGKLLYDYEAKSEEDFVNSAEAADERLNEHENYKKAYRFADDEYKAHLVELNNKYVFSSGMKLFNSAVRESDYIRAKEIFDIIPNYPPAKEKSAECLAKGKDSKDINYNKAVDFMNSGDYAAAISEFNDLKGYKDSFERIYNCGVAAMNKEKYLCAVFAFRITKDYKDSKDLLKECLSHLPTHTFSTDRHQVIGLDQGGNVIVDRHCRIDHDSGQYNVTEWSDIVAVSTEGYKTVGLKADGTVVESSKRYNEGCKVPGWENVVAVQTVCGCIIGLTSDGRVLAKNGYTNLFELCNNISMWTDIVEISVVEQYDHVCAIGLKTDGTVVAYQNSDIPCKDIDVSEWKDIVALSVNPDLALALKSDGTVVVQGREYYKQCIETDWKDIVAICTDHEQPYGLKADGTVITARSELWNANTEMLELTDIVAISAGPNSHGIYCLKSDGTVAYGHLSGSDIYRSKLCSDPKQLEIQRRERKERKIREQEARRKQEIAAIRKQIAEFEKQKKELMIELSQLKGIFSGPKKHRLETQINEIDGQISALNMQITKE